MCVPLYRVPRRPLGDLVIGTAAKMAMNLRLSPVSLFFSLVALAAIGWLQLPLIPLLIVLVPLSIAAAAWNHLV
jgi:hypothetical protein